MKVLPVQHRHFLMKAATAAAGGLSGVGLQVVGYNAKAAVQSAGTILGIRVLMIVIRTFQYHKWIVFMRRISSHTVYCSNALF